MKAFFQRIIVIGSVFLGGIGLFMSGPGAQALTFPEKPKAHTWYVDEAGLLKPDHIQQLTTLSGNLLKEKGIPLVVVTIQSLESHGAGAESIETYAQKLFNAWGIGSQKNNHGVLLLVSPGDRKARIELGRDFKHRYDEDASEIMNSVIIPAFKAGQFSQGILEGAKALDQVVRGLGIPQAEASTTGGMIFVGIIILIVLLIIGASTSLVRSGKTGWAWVSAAAMFGGLFWLFRTPENTNKPNNTDSDSSGGSDSGFGGGDSGGDGATGSW